MILKKYVDLANQCFKPLSHLSKVYSLKSCTPFLFFRLIFAGRHPLKHFLAVTSKIAKLIFLNSEMYLIALFFKVKGETIFTINILL